MRTREIQQVILSRIQEHFDAREAAAVARVLAEFVAEETGNDTDSFIRSIVERVLSGEPVQYITGYTWFYHLKIGVSPAVLIPRPETEELVEWIVENAGKDASLRILDIGTGSGCIALALKSQLPHASVTGIDVSQSAINKAMANAQALDLQVRFLQQDILRQIPSDQYDILVSNPPYITQEEYEDLPRDVRGFEPGIALIAQAADPFVFYRRIAHVATRCLTQQGALFFELNEFHAQTIEDICHAEGFTTELRTDLQGKPRMLQCIR